MAQRIQEEIRALPTIEAESHFVKIGRKMLCADLMPRSDDAAFQERECRFDCVSRDTSAVLIPRIFFGTVVHGFMLQLANGSLVATPFVSDNHFHILTNILSDVFGKRSCAGIGGMEKPQIAVALADTDNNFLSFHSSLNTLSALATAHIGFVHFDSTVKHGLVYFFHGCADAMAEIPCCLVGAFVLAPDRALQLVSAHALFGFAEQKRSEKPLLQRQVRVIEDRASGDGKLVVAVLAVEQLLFGFQFYGGHLAAHTFNATGPAKAHEQLAALLVSIEQVNNVN